MSNTLKLGIPTPITKHGFVHPLVRQTAIECAQALYERLARNNTWYELNKDRERWVAERWKDLLPNARQSLAACLRSKNLSEVQKREIADALIKDNELRVGRARGQTRRVQDATKRLWH